MKEWMRKHSLDRAGLTEDKLRLLQEIREAHENWVAARDRLNWAYETTEEIDYAIFALAAAEKKYDLLLKQAKALEWDGTPFRVI